MTYRHAVTRENYADLSGGVLYSAPGFPAFPARLASEIFQRALALAPDPIARIWDPCCGSGHLLTTLAVLHRRDIASVLGTDLDPAALTLAQSNLDLLGDRALEDRSEELRSRAERLDKPAYLEVAAAAKRLAARLDEGGGPLPHRVARADALNASQLARALHGHRPNLVITDIPYGEQTSWGGPDAAAGITGMLEALEEVLDDGAVIAVATRGRTGNLDETRRPVTSFKIGTRRMAIYRVARAQAPSHRHLSVRPGMRRDQPE